LWTNPQTTCQEEKKADVVRTIMDMYDADKSGTISFAEFTTANAKVSRCPISD